MRVAKGLGLGILIIGALIAIAWATSPDPRTNPASFEGTPLSEGLAPLSQAITLASVEGERGDPVTLLVTAFDDKGLSGVALSDLGAEVSGNFATDLSALKDARLSDADIEGVRVMSVGWDKVYPAGPTGDRHIGSGTNFPEHAEEANSQSVFQFPKFGSATPARTNVSAPSGILLDYEVELCIRFDRDIASLEDFDAAVKGVFLCGDFTNRNAIVELVDPDNLDSGSGFSDAKSGPGHFPTGPFVVVPTDWDSFVDETRMTTGLNGEARQDARGKEMTLDFRELVAKALVDMDKPRFLYQDDYFTLAPGNAITTEMALMSGTSEGTIFTSPTRGDYVEMVAEYLAAGGPFSGEELMEAGKRRFIANELETRHFLQPGDRVRHSSNWLGTIEVEVIE